MHLIMQNMISVINVRYNIHAGYMIHVIWLNLVFKKSMYLWVPSLYHIKQWPPFSCTECGFDNLYDIIEL